MTASINNQLDTNITDFLLLQEISEIKLNRILGHSGVAEIRFYNNYKNSTDTNDFNLRNEFYTTVGAQENLNNSSANEYTGGAGAYTKISQTQADYFLDNYDIVDYYGNDNTGFSATTYRKKGTNEITISFRSTEFKEDYYKDAYGADQEINNNGTAIAQNISLVNYLKYLKNNNVISTTSALNITGYSLGGHLASSAYQYLSSDGYNINKLYVFNGPGVGNVSSPYDANSSTTTSNFGYLKDDLLNYTQITNIFEILRLQNITDSDNAKDFVNSNSNNILLKSFFNSLSTYTLRNILQSDIEQGLNTSTLNIYDSITNSYSLHETEQDKSKNNDINENPSYLNTTIYSSEIYKAFKNYIVSKYNMSKATSANSNGTIDTLEKASQSEKTGVEDLSLFGKNTMWINGQSSVNNFDYMSNDFNMVANSNRYGYNTDVVIEDRPEFENGAARLPVADNLTLTLNGDFGNTHSITLLNKSLNLMVTLAHLEGKSTIDVAKYSAIISSASKERAAHFYETSDGNNGTGDYDAISNVINTLIPIFLPHEKPIMFNASIGGWADISIINKLDAIEQKLKALNVSNLKIVSLYDLKADDLTRTKFNQTTYHYMSKEDLIQSAKENVAYRYALDKLNTYVIENADYSFYQDTKHSDEWYSSRADILLKIIDSNVQNSMNYTSSGVHITDDNATRSYNSGNNIYVNDNKQDLLFGTNHSNPNVDYKIYNKDSYYAQSREVVKFSNFDQRFWNFTKTIVKEASYKFLIPDISSPYTDAGIVGSVKFVASRAALLGSTVAGSISFLAAYGVASIDNINTIGNANAFNPDSINYANYLSNVYLRENVNIFIGNYTQRESKFIDKNIYFLDSTAIDYKSNNTGNKNENIFIATKTQDVLDALKNQTFLGQYSTTDDQEPNEENLVLYHDVKLGDGDDYIEIDDSYFSSISSSSGSKTYNIHGTTSIVDHDKSGKIYLDDILLEGGTFRKNSDGNYDYTKKIQTYTSDELDENGKPKTYDIKYELVNGSLLITNEKTNHAVSISGLTNYGNGKFFNFKDDPKENLDGTISVSSDDFKTKETDPISITKTYSSSYSNSDDIDAIFNININISSKNVVVNKLKDSPTDLFIYDKTNPKLSYLIHDYFNIDGSVKSHSFDIVTPVPGNPSIHQYESRKVKINSLDFDDIARTNSTGSTLNQGTSPYKVYLVSNTEFYYSKNAKYFIDGSLTTGLILSKKDNDLILSTRNIDHALNSYTATIKDYFAFDHSNNTNLYFHNSITGEDKPVSISELIKLNTTKLSDTGVNYTMNKDSSLSVASGLGNDVIYGTSRNETIYSSSQFLFVDSGNYSISDGNDKFTGGGGDDQYIFSGNFGNDTITDFNQQSRIIITANQYQFKKLGNDLIVLKDYDPSISQDYSSVTIKDYFKNVDYLNDSRITFVSDNNVLENYQADNSLLNSTNYQFTQNEVTDFNTTNLDPNQEVVAQNSIDNSNNTVDETKLSSSYIKGNDLDNTIIIRNNDTIIHSNQTAALTDGNDTYIVDIGAYEALNPNHNQYRTTVEFGYNSGHDSLINASFKETNQYGDIVQLKNIDSSSIVVNKIKNDSGVLVGVNVILTDGSSIIVSLNDLKNENVDIIQTSDKVIKLSELLDMASPDITIGDSLNNSFNFSMSNKSVNIKGMDGNDLIKGSKSDDLIEGGTGFDQYQFSGGVDTYVFNKNSDIDTFNTDTISASELQNFEINFLIDSSFKETTKYLFNDKENEAYLKFSDTDGVVFTNVTWDKFITLVSNINIKFSDNTTKSLSVAEVEDFPFIKSVKMIDGSSGSDYLQTNGVYSSVVYGEEGNDTIVSNGASYNTRNFIFGGEGNDTITANDGDIVVVKDGDGSDTIKTSDRSFVLEILHNTPRLVNGQEVLFDLSASSTSDDLVINYGNSSSDNIIIQDYFESNDNEISFVIYDEVTDKSFVFNDLKTILSSLNINKSSLINQSSITVYKTAVTADMIGNTGQLLGGELTAQYLAGNYLQDANKISHIIDNQLNGQPLQNKVYQ